MKVCINASGNMSVALDVGLIGQLAFHCSLTNDAVNVEYYTYCAFNFDFLPAYKNKYP